MSLTDCFDLFDPVENFRWCLGVVVARAGHRASGENARVEDAPENHADVPFLGEGKERFPGRLLEERIAPRQENGIGIGIPDKTLRRIRIVHPDAVSLDDSLIAQTGQCGHRSVDSFFECRFVVVPVSARFEVVHENHFDMIPAKAEQRLFEGAHHAIAAVVKSDCMRGAPEVAGLGIVARRKGIGDATYLGGDNNVRARNQSQGGSDAVFGQAVSIEWRGVEQVDPAIQRGPDSFLSRGLINIRIQIPNDGAAKAEGRNPEAGSSQGALWKLVRHGREDGGIATVRQWVAMVCQILQLGMLVTKTSFYYDSDMSDDPTIGTAVKKGGGFFLFIGFLVLLLGVFAMSSPMVAGIAITVLIGVLLVLSGIFQVLHGFRVFGSGAKILTILVGVLTVVVGVYVLLQPLSALAGLTLILAIYFVADGILTGVAAFQARPTQGWGWLLFSGIITLLLGLIIWRQWPLSGVWAIGILIGVRILMNGMTMIFMGSAARVIGKGLESAEAQASLQSSEGVIDADSEEVREE